MDPTALETLSRWASVAGVVLSALAAIAITVAAYTSSRLVADTSTRSAQLQAESARAIASVGAQATEAERTARAALAVANGLKAENERPHPDAADSTGPASPAVSGASPVATTSTLSGSPARPTVRRIGLDDNQTLVAILKEAASPPQVELSWVAAEDTYIRARAIGRALEEAGWTIIATGSLLTAATPVTTTITTGVLSDDALLLRKALETVGVKLSIVLEPSVPADRIQLRVGNDE
jgi:hypothetical protein